MSDVQVPQDHLPEPFPKLPETLEGLVEFVEGWWTDGGDRSRFAFYIRACKYTTMAFPKDLNVLSEIQGKHAAILGWVSEQIPDSLSFLQHAMGVATMELPKRVEGWIGMKDRERKALLEKETALFSKIVKSFERLGATVTHRMESLRTAISTERTIWEHTMAGGNRQTLSH